MINYDKMMLIMKRSGSRNLRDVSNFYLFPFVFHSRSSWIKACHGNKLTCGYYIGVITKLKMLDFDHINNLLKHELVKISLS